MDDTDMDDAAQFKVIVNHEEQYSLWPADKKVPGGWADAGKSGSRSECRSFVDAVWTDMRPLSLRERTH